MRAAFDLVHYCALSPAVAEVAISAQLTIRANNVAYCPVVRDRELEQCGVLSCDA